MFPKENGEYGSKGEREYGSEGRRGYDSKGGLGGRMLTLGMGAGEGDTKKPGGLLSAVRLIIVSDLLPLEKLDDHASGVISLRNIHRQSFHHTPTCCCN